MIRNTERKNWNKLRAKITSRFAKLTTPQVDGLRGHMDKLPGVVKKAYNYDQTKADRECKAFNKTIQESA